MSGPERKPLTLLQLLQTIRRLWMWGCLDYPGDRTDLIVDDDEWKKLVRDFDSTTIRADDPFFAGQQWIRRVFKVELEWRLWRAIAIGAVLGFLLAIR